MKAKVRFKQADVARALKATNSAGLKVARVDIDPDGRISMTIADGSKIETPTTSFDNWRTKRDARPA